MRAPRVIAAGIAVATFLAFSADVQAEDLRPETGQFLSGAASHTIHHEIAHMLIDRLQLPVVGREEDAADQYAWLQMIRRWRETGNQAPIRAAILLWHLEHRRASSEDDRVPAWSEHSSDRQRLFLGICLVAGLEPGVFGDLAAQYGMPEDRLDACNEEAELIEAAWLDLLDLAEPAGSLRAELVIEETAADGSAASGIDPRLAEMAVRRGVIPARRILDELNTVLGFEVTVGLRFASCGEADAFYDPEAAEVLICFEEINGYVDLLQYR